MGTRNLTMVISNGKTKVAQYGQWDGYPEGQGATALEFLKNADLKVFKAKVDKCKFISDKKIESYYKNCGSDGSDFVNMTVSQRFKALHPQLDRDMAAEVLAYIYNSDKPVELHDMSDFANDSLFCEWAYVIDLDKGTFEVYEGFNETPLAEGDRFYGTKSDNEYNPVKLVKSYPLTNLPDKEVFIKDFETEEVEED